MHWEQAHRQPVLKEAREEHPLADTSKNRALLVPLSQSGMRALKLVSPAVLSQGASPCPLVWSRVPQRVTLSAGGSPAWLRLAALHSPLPAPGAVCGH